MRICLIGFIWIMSTFLAAAGNMLDSFSPKKPVKTKSRIKIRKAHIRAVLQVLYFEEGLHPLKGKHAEVIAGKLMAAEGYAIGVIRIDGQEIATLVPAGYSGNSIHILGSTITCTCKQKQPCDLRMIDDNAYMCITQSCTNCVMHNDNPSPGPARPETYTPKQLEKIDSIMEDYNKTHTKKKKRR